jgi:hypothetical protein
MPRNEELKRLNQLVDVVCVYAIFPLLESVMVIMVTIAVIFCEMRASMAFGFFFGNYPAGEF